MKTLHVNLSTEPAGPIAFKEGMRPFITVRTPQESNGESISPVKTPVFFSNLQMRKNPWGFCFKHSDGQVFGRLGKALFWAGFPFTSICCFNRVGNHSLVLVGCEESPLGAQYGAHVEWYRSIIAPSSLITTKMLLDIPSCFVADILDWRFKWLMICVFFALPFDQFFNFPVFVNAKVVSACTF